MPLTENRIAEAASLAPEGSEDVRREEAVKQIQRRRRFHKELVSSAVGTALLIAIWASSEFHNAGGWPTKGFSESSGIQHVWNVWIIYPVIGIALILASRAWSVYGHRPISESEIEREIEKQSGLR